MRMIAAVLPHHGRVWFFKISGPAPTVEAQAQNFDAFVRSVHFHAADEASEDETPTTARSFDGVNWIAPGAWILDAEKPMRVATYRTSADADAPQLIVTRFPKGQFGSLVANINRWRGQVGLDPVENEADQASETISVGGNEGHFFDLTGTTGRSLVAMIPAGEIVWFFRLTGAPDAVGAERSNLDAFLKSVQFK
jgi:hypothetical protein